MCALMCKGKRAWGAQNTHGLGSYSLLFAGVVIFHVRSSCAYDDKACRFGQVGSLVKVCALVVIDVMVVWVMVRPVAGLLVGGLV
jgi:hypothetical protein